MRKATVFAAALALVLSLAACGNQDNNGGQAGNPNGTNNGQTNSGQTGNGAEDNNGSLTDQNGGAGMDGQTTRSWTGGSAGTGTGDDSQTRSWTGGANSGARSTVGNDLQRAADGVGNAVEDAMDDGRDMLSRTASATTFERMLDNARVHDTDGVLTDGENSRW